MNILIIILIMTKLIWEEFLMAKTIRVDDDVYEGLKELAEPFKDDPNSVIKRLLEKYNFSEENETISQDQPSETVGEDLREDSEIVESDFADVKVSYEFSRLCFLAKLIDPIEDDDIFQVVTKRDGTFRFTKSDFYKTFPNVISSKSYQQNGIYHYPTVPNKAKAFQVRGRRV